MEEAKVVGRGFAALLISAAGMLLCATVASFAYPMDLSEVVWGAVIGFLLFLILGCLITGLYQHIIPSGQDVSESLLPPTLLGGKGPVHLILTIHKVEKVRIQGQMPWQSPDLFFEVTCGENPVKNTCVKKDEIFNEEMRLNVSPLDQTIKLRLKNQDFFGSSDVGYCVIDVIGEIIALDFPTKKKYLIESMEGDWLSYSASGGEQPSVTLSFRSADVYIDEQKKKRMNYGATGPPNFEYVSTMQFDTTQKLEKGRAQEV